ncbi:MAG TPA: fluoride efflux transporter CrcB [Candidatus Limnocylindrales bacterium]
MPILLIALGGAAGAVSRYLVDTWVSERAASAFPWGTFVVNVSGSFVLGLLFALAVEADVLPAGIRLPVMVGFVGAYTTFSTLMLESWVLVESGAIPFALANLVGSTVVGVVALVIGLALGRLIA